MTIMLSKYTKLKNPKNGKKSNLSMFKSRKNFEKMDKKNVQKSNRRNLFVQKRAALGNLRNFFSDNL